MLHVWWAAHVVPSAAVGTDHRGDIFGKVGRQVSNVRVALLQGGQAASV